MTTPTHPGRGSRSSAPLRIGMMLRGIHEVDGPGVYIRALCDAMFDLPSPHRFFAYYISGTQAGRFSDRGNVTERTVSSPSKLLWDQILVPVAARRDNLDILFHHKFTIPLHCPCPTVVEQQGAEYWTHPEWYGFLEKWHAKAAIPLYCQSADRVLAISRSLARQLSPHVGIPSDQIDHIHAAPDPRFRPVQDPDRIALIRKKYALPEDDFFLMVAKGYSSATTAGEAFYPRKNVGGVLEAYSRLHGSLGNTELPSLVVAGPGFDDEGVEQYLAGVDERCRRKICFPGLIDFDDMPVLYSLAGALLFPSYSESFGIPLVEAMACGCPVITSDTTSCPEVVGDAGLLVDPHSAPEIAEAMGRLIRTPGLRRSLAEKGLERAGEFSWSVSARKLLGILEDVARSDGRAGSHGRNA